LLHFHSLIFRAPYNTRVADILILNIRTYLIAKAHNFILYLTIYLKAMYNITVFAIKYRGKLIVFAQ